MHGQRDAHGAGAEIRQAHKHRAGEEDGADTTEQATDQPEHRRLGDDASDDRPGLAAEGGHDGEVSTALLDGQGDGVIDEDSGDADAEDGEHAEHGEEAGQHDGGPGRGIGRREHAVPPPDRCLQAVAQRAHVGARRGLHVDDIQAAGPVEEPLGDPQGEDGDSSPVEGVEAIHGRRTPDRYAPGVGADGAVGADLVCQPGRHEGRRVVGRGGDGVGRATEGPGEGFDAAVDA